MELKNCNEAPSTLAIPADLLRYVADILHSLSYGHQAGHPRETGESPAPESLPAAAPATAAAATAMTPLPPPAAPARAQFQELLPKVSVIGQRVYCNDVALDLDKRPLTLRLFQTFCNGRDYQVTREDILRYVYRIANLETRPSRYVDAVYNNSVKLISRARMLAANHLGRATQHGAQWFVYDQERKIWSLFRLRQDFLYDRLH